MNLAKNKKLVLSVALNVLLMAALSMLLYLVYPQFLYELQSVENWGCYSVGTYRTRDGNTGYFEVLMRPEESGRRPQVPRRMYSCSGTQAFFVETFGVDVTGNGVPDVVVRQWNGSASDYGSRYRVLELDGSGAKELTVIEGLSSVKREDVNKDGVDELIGYDEAYCFWGGYDRASSPSPLVVLSFDENQGRFILNRKLMAKPPLSDEKLRELSLTYKNDAWWSAHSAPPGELFRTMFDLIYSGNEKQAWELLDTSWSGGSKISKEEWKAEVEDTLRYSPYSPGQGKGVSP